jgi:uncharacterized membrane protein
MMRFGNFGGPGQGNGVGFFFCILLIVFLGAFLWLLLSTTHRRNFHGHSSFTPHPHGPHDDHHGGPDLEARRILDRRLASGEIDEEEYLRRRKLLEGDS